jgi:hypothetical protein
MYIYGSRVNDKGRGIDRDDSAAAGSILKKR